MSVLRRGPTVVLPLSAHHDHMGRSELVRERVTKEDSGSYTCVAENTAGTIKAVAFVYVKGASITAFSGSVFMSSQTCPSCSHAVS